MLLTKGSTPTSPHVIKLHRYPSIQTHEQQSLSKSASRRRIIIQTRIHPGSIIRSKNDNQLHPLRSTDHGFYNAKSIESRKLDREPTSKKHFPSFTKSNNNQWGTNNWNNECNIDQKTAQHRNNNRNQTQELSAMEEGSLTSIRRHYPETESDVSLSTVHTPNSFSKWSSRTDSTDNIRDIKEQKKRRKRKCGSYCYCSPLCVCLSLFGGLLVASGIAALLVGLLVKFHTTSTTHATSSPRLLIFNGNMIINGDAESGPCETGSGVTHPTGWNYNGTITQIYYNNTPYGDQTLTSPGPSDRGQCYFYGQISASTSMWQVIDLSNQVDPFLIDAHIVNFNLSAWLGGYTTQDDSVMISLTFADQLNQSIGSIITLGPVLAIDRANQTSLVFRQTNGIVPVGTRVLTVNVIITRVAGTYNDGDVDNIGLILYQ